jgi:hypothetical protein
VVRPGAPGTYCCTRSDACFAAPTDANTLGCADPAEQVFCTGKAVTTDFIFARSCTQVTGAKNDVGFRGYCCSPPLGGNDAGGDGSADATGD